MRSDLVKKGVDKAPHRSLLRATGQIESDSDFDSDSEYEYELDECIVTDKSIQHWDGSAKTLMHFKNLCNIKKSPQEMNSIKNRYQY